MLEVNEKSPVRMTIVFTDFDGSPQTPITVDRRLDDKTNNTELTAWTSVPAPASTMVFTVPGDDNVINDENRTSEVHVFGIRVDDGLIGEAYAELEYTVNNLIGPSGA